MSRDWSKYNEELALSEKNSVLNTPHAVFKFALDDFGSGFASFTYLKFFPIDVVKIEGEFIRSMLTSEIDRTFVESAVSMAKVLNIKTIAEYVENENILRAVKEVGVDYTQGYFIGKPSEEVC